MTKICGVGKLMNRHVPWGGSGGGGSLPPELRDALIGVWVVGKKTNDSPDRTIIKNKIPNAGGDFQLLNFAYKLNSGYGEYGADFESFDWTTDITKRTSAQATIGVNGRLCNHTAIEIGAMKVNIKGNVTDLRYWYIANPDDTARSEMQLTSGVNVLPKSYAKDDGQTYNVGFAYISGDPEITIEQIPSWQGSIRTDGVSDLIVSMKTAQEMGIESACTFVSMMGNVVVPSDATFNNMRNNGAVSGRNVVQTAAEGTTGIFGWSKANVGGSVVTVINNVMGDKNNYKAINGTAQVGDQKFSVEGFQATDGTVKEVSQVAWYWTFAAKKVLTGDDINQIIAAYNLDEYVNATLYYDIKKQGITNENHASFSDQLVDYSGNGRNMQLYNIAWDGDSGIGKYNYPGWRLTATTAAKYKNIRIYQTLNGTYTAEFKGVTELYNRVGIGLEILSKNRYLEIKKDGIYSVDPVEDATELQVRFGDFTNTETYDCDVVITQIPVIEGGLCLDGVNDYGQFVGNLGLKDYTVAINRAYQSLINNQVPLVSSNLTTDNTPFLMEHWNTDTNAISFSFGASKITNVPLDISKKITYQSTYSYMGDAINKGTSTSIGDGLTLGKYGAGVQYASIVLWNLLLFPYSLSPFLLERQLKKYKVGTLYPDMVEWRPKVKSDDRIKSINFYINLVGATVGNYYPIGAGLGIAVEPVAPYYVNSLKVNGKATIPNADHKGFNGTLDAKSPQNITMDIVVDGSLVQWNPTYNSNVAYQSVTCLNYSDRLKTVNVGDYVKVGDALAVRVILANTLDEVANTKVNGQECEIVVVSPRVFDCKFFVTSDSPQKVDITIDEYVRFEDLVQPYPVFVGLGSITWGSKLKVGSTISFIGMTNLLSEYYSINGELLFNGVPFNRNSGQHVIEKTNAFSFSQPFTYIGDGNEPKCILYPERLSIPNGSYQILGYIPDISGHGNNGRFNNFAFTSESGANEDGSIHFDGVTDFIDVPNTVGGKQMIMKVQWDEPTADAIIYDQRGYPNEFAIYNADTYNDGTACVAYQARNSGRTFIDGILNSNIKASELKTIKHIITSTNELSSGANNKAPHIGCNSTHDAYFTNMALWCFMLFDNISTDEEITELNRRIGVEAKVSYPEYYWDAYGKTNDDATDIDGNRTVMPNKNENLAHLGLSLYNFAFDLMSGYGGWEFPKFTDDVAWYISPNASIEVVNRTDYSVTLRKLANVDYYYFQKAVGLIYRQVPFKVRTDKAIKVCWDLHYTPTGGTEQSLRLVEQLVQPNVDTMVTLTYKTEEELNDLNADLSTVFYIVYFDLYTMTENEEVTVTELPLYPNGLCLDGVTDYLVNAIIPVLSDFTCIGKRLFLPSMAGSRPYVIKGDRVNSGGIGNAFLMEFNGGVEQYSFGTKNQNTEAEVPALISYMTPTSYNGKAISRGTGVDTAGLFVGGTVSSAYTPMVFYKLMLYTKSLTTLEINYLKNMFARDEIIDLGNPIFLEAAPPPSD